MNVADSTLSCALMPKTFGDDEWNSGDGEVIGAEAAAAVLGAAPSGVDRAELARELARLSYCHARLRHVLRHVRRAAPTSGGAALTSVAAWRSASIRRRR